MQRVLTESETAAVQLDAERLEALDTANGKVGELEQVIARLGSQNQALISESYERAIDCWLHLLFTPPPHQ